MDWNSFAIGAGNVVLINNGAGAALNRVTGTSASTVAGALIGTGLSNSGSITAANGTAGIVTANNLALADASDPAGLAVALNAAGGKVYTLEGDTAGLIQATGTTSINEKVWLFALNGTTRVAGTQTGCTELAGGVLRQTRGVQVVSIIARIGRESHVLERSKQGEFRRLVRQISFNRDHNERSNQMNNKQINTILSLALSTNYFSQRALFRTPNIMASRRREAPRV